MELNNGGSCGCGKKHVCDVKKLIIEKGALASLPSLLYEAGAEKPFLIMDENTKKAAGDTVSDILKNAGILFSSYVYETTEPLAPTEETFGRVMMFWDPSCDCIVAVGSGVINDVSKLVSRVSGRPYILVLTAPSMDGMVSPTSSMDVQSLKVSLPSAAVHSVVADIDVLTHAPRRMILAGFGDMLAKYISVTEWKLSHIITGEYYCEKIASLLQSALQQVFDAAPRLLSGDEEAIRILTDGLLLAGCAMAYAGVTRPASGMEHYISHIIDMRHLVFGTPADLHGIQAGIGTLYTLKLYEEIEKIDAIDIAKAERYAAAFDYDEWSKTLRAFVGKSAESMIALEAKERKYDKASHKARIKKIAEKWPELRSVMKEMLPPSQKIEDTMKGLGMPLRLTELGVAPRDIPTLVKCTKDIRDKYVGTRLLWDIGELDDILQKVSENYFDI